MRAPHEKILTPFHRELLKRFFASPVGPQFFLTGGTALAAYHLHHRLSEDLDLFTEEKDQVIRVRPVIDSIAAALGITVRLERESPAFVRVFFKEKSGADVKMEFAQDSPYRLQPVDTSAEGFRVDNALDISCNKLAALFGRAEGKDFVDIYFITRQLWPLDQFLKQARDKHVGMDAYWLAMAFRRVDSVVKWPEMITPCDFEALKAYFLAEARRLMDSLRS